MAVRGRSGAIAARMMKLFLGGALLAALALGCSEILELKEPTLADDEVDGGSDAPVDSMPGVCVPAACPFGCDSTTNACREGKLWLFKTGGSFFGNSFGGMDVPPNVRGGADGRCLVTYMQSYTMRECKPGNVHAILHVSSSDSIPLMATKYSVPTNVPVHRADDGVLVSNNWNDLTDPTKTLRAAATTAPAGDDAMVWTGANGVASCANWTSRAATESGTRANTSVTSATWLRQDTFRCDLLFSLLCACWAGP
jgi:hypothetical protein